MDGHDPAPIHDESDEQGLWFAVRQIAARVDVLERVGVSTQTPTSAREGRASLTFLVTVLCGFVGPIIAAWVAAGGGH
jgi:hypothetical protein